MEHVTIHCENRHAYPGTVRSVATGRWIVWAMGRSREVVHELMPNRCPVCAAPSQVWVTPEAASQDAPGRELASERV